MAIFKCLNNLYISTTQENLKKINLWKRTKLSLTKNFNHVIFISKAMKLGILPKGFRRKINAKVIDEKATQKRIGKIIMSDTKDCLLRDQSRLREKELGLRKELMTKLNNESWKVVEEKVNSMEKEAFIEIRSRQINKWENLMQESTKPHKEDDKKEKDTSGRLINISKHTLTKVEEGLLLKSLEFSPRENNTDHLELSMNTEITQRKLQLQDKMLSCDIKKVFSNKEVVNDNLNSEERLALEGLRKNKDIVISASDKGKVTVILDKEDYTSKLENIILSDDYEILKKDPTSKLDTLIRKIATKTKKRNNDTKLYYKLVGNGSRLPSIFGNVKVHKVGLPLRVIISSCGTITENAANYVKGILNYYVENWKNSHITRGIWELKKEQRSLELELQDDYVLASIDVINMFSNVSTDKAMEIIKNLVDKETGFETRSGMEKSDFLELLSILLNNSYFIYEGEFYRQVNGLPMGSGISPVIADLVMLDLEIKMMELDRASDLAFYRRFRDDSFIIWRGGIGKLLEFIEDINDLDVHQRLKFTAELGNEEGIAFLDAKIKIADKKLVFSVYNKPYSANVIMNFNSYQDISVKRSIIAGEVTRYVRISDNLEEDLDKLRQKFRDNDYPSNVVEQVMASTIKKLKRNKPKDGENKIWLPVNYPGQKRAKALRKISRKFKFNLAFKRNRTLGNIFSSTYKYNTRTNKGVVYAIPCSCKAVYIGETGKELVSRIKQHKYAVKVIDINNGPAVHCQECKGEILWEKAETLGYESKWYNRKIKESLWIQKIKPSMNLKEGFRLRGNWN